MSEAWATWLRTLPAPELAGVIERRPESVRGIPPEDLGELAERLVQGRALAAALQQVPLPVLQVAETAQALGGTTVGRDELVGILDGAGPAHLAAVDAALRQLVDGAVMVPTGDGRVALPAGFDELFPDPLHLGQPLRVLLRDVSVDAMRRQCRAYGLPKAQQNRAATVASLLAAFHEPGRLTAVLAAAPPDVVAQLAQAVEPDEDPYGYDPVSYRRREAAVEWARSAGPLVAGSYGYGGGLRVPAEVALALRGPGYRAPFTPEAPALQPVPASPERVAAESSAAAAGFAATALAVLDRVARTGVPTVAAGGVGARELVKLVKATGAGESETRLVLELAHAAGLVAGASRRLEVTAGFAAFRDREPAERFAALLSTWHELGATPTQARDADGKALPTAGRHGDCGGCRAARSALLDALAEVDGAVEPRQAAAAALWLRPLVHAVDDDAGVPLGLVWREAEMLGVIALGALTPLGRALGDGAALQAVAADLLPPSIDAVTFGADLTAYVPGAPSSRVSALLDGAADRESGGGAVTWRFTPASVRRALDEGTGGEALTAALAAVASAGLPQALQVLVGDVARRHGNIRVAEAVCVLRSDDEALLAEVVRDRRLRALGLRPVSATVLAGDLPLAETLAALRKAGYFPLADGVDGPDAAAGPRPAAVVPLRRRPAAVEPAAVEVDAAALARQLLRSGGGGDGSARPVSLTERLLSAAARSLSAAEVRQLAHAVDAGQPIGIGYESSTGAYTERVVQGLELTGGTLTGWCELRQAERMFSVRGIVSVQPV